MSRTDGPRRRRPPVELEHSDAVYDYYLRYRASRWRALMISGYARRKYRPRVSFDQSTADAIRVALSEKTPIVVAINHLADRDPYVVAGAALDSPLRPMLGRAQSLGKDELFIKKSHRWLIESMGGIPVFRGKDHGIRATNAAAQRLLDVCATRLSQGDNLMAFPEGTCNKADPVRVQAIGSGLGHIIFRSAKLGVSPVVVPVGIHYGPEPSSKYGASVWVGEPVADLPARPLDISRLIKTKLQDAVDMAVKNY